MMKSKAQIGLGIITILLNLVACQSGSLQKAGVWKVDLRPVIQKETPISMAEDISGIEYIPLETTDSCLISNITGLIMDDESIFVQNGRTQQIFQFTRQGQFVREVGKVGEGPGEYAPYTIEYLSLDSGQKELYANRHGLPGMVFSYDGEFLRLDTAIAESVGNRYFLQNGDCVLAGTPMTPIGQSPWLVALKSKSDQLLATKTPFPAGVPMDACYMKEIQFLPFQNSALAYTPCNDTLFRVSESGITPACILDRSNGTDYCEKIANINELAKDNTNTSSTIDVFTFFETPRFFYFRVLLLTESNKGFFLRLNKESGEILSQPVAQEFMDISIGYSDANIIGLENDFDGGIPFAPCFIYKDRVCVQAVNAETLAKLKDKGYLKTPPAVLQLGEDDNPLIIVYTFKN